MDDEEKEIAHKRYDCATYGYPKDTEGRDKIGTQADYAQRLLRKAQSLADGGPNPFETLGLARDDPKT